MTSGPDVMVPPVRYDRPGGAGALRHRRLVYAGFSAIVTAIMLFAVCEAVTGVTGYGIDSATTAATSATGTTLTVEYAKATRGQLATPFEATVEREGGFDGPVTLAVSASYLDLFLTNAITPEPSGETSNNDEVLLTFDPPPEGDVMRIRWEVVAKPASSFTPRHGELSVLDAGGTPEVTVTFETRVHV